MKLGTFGTAALALAGTALGAAAFAQAGGEPSGPGLSIPGNINFVGPADPRVRRATAIVNGVVITETDIDQRVALIAVANDGKIPAEELPRLREQVLRNLVDEVLQIHAAEAEEIKIEQREIDSYYQRYAQSFQRTPQDFSTYLRTVGSSDRAIKRQIHAEIAWTRVLRNRIEPFVSVSEDEVKAIIDRLNAARGTQEYRIGEIFISATPETAAEARANADRIVQQIRSGASFVAYARQFSEASTAAVGGDLGWVRAEQLPEQLGNAAKAMPVGSISDPIAIPGGYSIVAVQDTRQVLTADPRDAVLSLKQMSLAFPAGTPRAQVEARAQQLAQVAQTMGGCGRAEEAAQAIGADVVANDNLRARDLPGPLQEMMLSLSIGQATAPFGTLDEGVRVLVLCGRDDPDPAQNVSFQAIYDSLSEARVNMRARRYLRDLRRDAVVDYR